MVTPRPTFVNTLILLYYMCAAVAKEKLPGGAKANRLFMYIGFLRFFDKPNIQ